MFQDIFEDMLERTGTPTAVYNGKTIFLSDDLLFDEPTVRLIVSFDHTNKLREQGIRLHSEGVFTIGDQKFTGPISLWESTALSIVEMDFTSKDRKLRVWNMWKDDAGRTQYGHNGAAMLCEAVPAGKTYHCNDGYPDDDFKDLIFTMTVRSLGR